MRAPWILAIAMLTLALAGCSDDPPSGDFASTGSALSIAGSLEMFETQDYENPYSQSGGTEFECAQDQGAGTLPLEPCQYPYTKLSGNFSSLPDPAGGTYTAFFIDSTGTNADEQIGELQNVHQMAGAWMGELAFDNEDDCDGQKQNGNCVKTEMFDYVQIRLGSNPVARAALQQGAAFEIDPAMVGVSFAATWSGKDLTLTVNGLNGNLTYEAWLVSEDEEGAVTHDESFTVVGGDNEFTASQNINKFSGVHIHVAGTKLNVAVGAI